MVEEEKPKKQYVKWAAVLWYIYIHVLGVYAIWLMFTSAKWMTIFYTIFIIAIGYLGVTAGAHRLWAHKTYEAVGFIKLFLMLAHTLAGVGSIYDWILYHRIHHKYYGTDKDPYNHKKGFLYSHYISNILSFNMSLEEMKRNVDLRDIDNDAYVYFQKMISSNIMNIFFKKSFWPKYHYIIPWDWKSGEFGTYNNDCTTFFIKMWHELNLVNSLLTTDTEDIRNMLHEMSIKKITLKDSLEILKKKSIFDAQKTKLIVKH